MTWHRPWAKLVVKHPDGIETWLVYMEDNAGVGAWRLQGRYPETSPIGNLSTKVATYITAIQPRMQSQIDTLNVENIGDKQLIADNYYSKNARKNIDTKHVLKDGAENLDINDRLIS